MDGMGKVNITHKKKTENSTSSSHNTTENWEANKSVSKMRGKGKQHTPETCTLALSRKLSVWDA